MTVRRRQHFELALDSCIIVSSRGDFHAITMVFVALVRVIVARVCRSRESGGVGSRCGSGWSVSGVGGRFCSRSVGGGVGGALCCLITEAWRLDKQVVPALALEALHLASSRLVEDAAAHLPRPLCGSGSGSGLEGESMELKSSDAGDVGGCDGCARLHGRGGTGYMLGRRVDEVGSGDSAAGGEQVGAPTEVREGRQAVRRGGGPDGEKGSTVAVARGEVARVRLLVAGGGGHDQPRSEGGGNGAVEDGAVAGGKAEGGNGRPACGGGAGGRPFKAGNGIGGPATAVTVHHADSVQEGSLRNTMLRACGDGCRECTVAIAISPFPDMVSRTVGEHVLALTEPGAVFIVPGLDAGVEHVHVNAIACQLPSNKLVIKRQASLVDAVEIPVGLDAGASICRGKATDRGCVDALVLLY